MTKFINKKIQSILMQKRTILAISIISALVISISSYQVAQAQIRYTVGVTTHIKFFSSISLDDLSTQFNKFVVEKEFSSNNFELVSVEVINFDRVSNQYTIMVTYKDINEEIPDRVINELARNKPLEVN